MHVMCHLLITNITRTFMIKRFFQLGCRLSHVYHKFSDMYDNMHAQLHIQFDARILINQYISVWFLRYRIMYSKADVKAMLFCSVLTHHLISVFCLVLMKYNYSHQIAVLPASFLLSLQINTMKGKNVRQLNIEYNKKGE